MPRGRPKKATRQTNIKLQIETIEKLKKVNPSLLTVGPDGKRKFRHGALGRYIERLILEDISTREKSFTMPNYPQEFLNEKPE